MSTHSKISKPPYIRVGEVSTSPEEIISLLREILQRKRSSVKVTLPNNSVKEYLIKSQSERYQVFARDQLKCYCCSIVGSILVAEINRNQSILQNPHLNLYAINSANKEILMTKDHVIPSSKGGEDHLRNLKTMCLRCNMKKADRILDEK